MDNPELIEQYERELWDTVRKMHQDGISYDAAHDTLERMTKALDTMAYSEGWLSQYAPESPLAAP